jgi:hypothetical protein
MNTPSAPKAPDEEPFCSTCFKPIHRMAKKCTECDSYQDWRRHMQLGSSVLALMVALVSVTALSAPILSQLMTQENSNIHVSLQTVLEPAIYLMATNDGVRAGSVAEIHLSIKNVEGLEQSRWGFGLRPVLIRAGAAQQIVIPISDGHQSVIDEAWWKALNQGDATNVIGVTVKVQDFNSYVHEEKLTSPIREFLLAGGTPWHLCVINNFYSDERHRANAYAPTPTQSAVKKRCGGLPWEADPEQVPEPVPNPTG